LLSLNGRLVGTVDWNARQPEPRALEQALWCALRMQQIKRGLQAGRCSIRPVRC